MRQRHTNRKRDKRQKHAVTNIYREKNYTETDKERERDRKRQTHKKSERARERERGGDLSLSYTLTLLQSINLLFLK